MVLPSATAPASPPSSLTTSTQQLLFHVRFIDQWRPSTHSTAQRFSFFGLELELRGRNGPSAASLVLEFQSTLTSQRQQELRGIMGPFTVIVVAKMPQEKANDHQKPLLQLTVPVQVNNQLERMNKIHFLKHSTTGMDVYRALKRALETVSVARPCELTFLRHNHSQAAAKIRPFAARADVQEAQVAQFEKLQQEESKWPDERRKRKQFVLQQLDFYREHYLFDYIGDRLQALHEEIMGGGQWHAYEFEKALWYYHAPTDDLFAEHPMRNNEKTRELIGSVQLRTRMAARKLQHGTRSFLQRNRMITAAMERLLAAIVDEVWKNGLDGACADASEARAKAIKKKLQEASVKTGKVKGLLGKFMPRKVIKSSVVEEPEPRLETPPLPDAGPTQADPILDKPVQVQPIQVDPSHAEPTSDRSESDSPHESTSQMADDPPIERAHDPEINPTPSGVDSSSEHSAVCEEWPSLTGSNTTGPEELEDHTRQDDGEPLIMQLRENAAIMSPPPVADREPEPLTPLVESKLELAIVKTTPVTPPPALLPPRSTGLTTPRIPRQPEQSKPAPLPETVADADDPLQCSTCFDSIESLECEPQCVLSDKVEEYDNDDDDDDVVTNWRSRLRLLKAHYQERRTSPKKIKVQAKEPHLCIIIGSTSNPLSSAIEPILHDRSSSLLLDLASDGPLSSSLLSSLKEPKRRHESVNHRLASPTWRRDGSFRSFHDFFTGASAQEPQYFHPTVSPKPRAAARYQDDATEPQPATGNSHGGRPLDLATLPKLGPEIPVLAKPPPAAVSQLRGSDGNVPIHRTNAHPETRESAPTSAQTSPPKKLPYIRRRKR